MSKVPITVKGAEKLKQELQQLKSVDRPKVIEAIAEARAHGDLKENAEYHAAREQQGFIEGRIKDIEAKLSNATIIDVTTLDQNGKVVFGVTVDVADEAHEDRVILPRAELDHRKVGFVGIETASQRQLTQTRDDPSTQQRALANSAGSVQQRQTGSH